MLDFIIGLDQSWIAWFIRKTEKGMYFFLTSSMNLQGFDKEITN